MRTRAQIYYRISAHSGGGIRIDGNFCVGGEAESGVAAEQARGHRFSKARNAGECCAITAANAKALGPVAVPVATKAVFCMTVRTDAGMISFFICAVSDRNPSSAGQSRAYGARSMRLRSRDAAKLEWRRRASLRGRCDVLPVSLGRPAAEPSDHGHRRLLRACPQLAMPPLRRRAA